MNGKKIIFAILAIFVAFGLCVAFRTFDFSIFNFTQNKNFTPQAQNDSIMLYIPSRKAENGKIDLRDVDFFTETCKLLGEWYFCPEEILTPLQIQNKIENFNNAQFVKFPHFLSKHNILQSGFSHKNLINCATFALKIILPANFFNFQNQKLALFIEPITSDFCIFANSTLIFEGKNNLKSNIIEISPEVFKTALAKNTENNQNGENPQNAQLNAQSTLNGEKIENNSILLTIQIKDFKNSKNFNAQSPKIALYSNLQTQKTVSEFFNTLLLGAFFALFLYCLIRFFQNKNEKFYISFSIASIFSILALIFQSNSLLVEIIFSNSIFFNIANILNCILPFVIYSNFALFLWQNLKENIKKQHILAIFAICSICIILQIVLPQSILCELYSIFDILEIFCIILLVISSIKIAKAKTNASILIVLCCIFLIFSKLNEFFANFYIINTFKALPVFSFLLFVLLCIFVQSNFYSNFNALQNYSSNLYKINKSLDRFIPVELLKRINSKSLNNVQLGDSVQMQMTVLVLKVQHFNLRAKHMQSVDAFGFLNELWAYLLPSIKQNGGVVAKYSGHGFLAIFENPSDNALLAVTGIKESLKNFNARLAKLASAEEEVRLSIGIHSGFVMLGTIGEKTCIETTLIGETIDIAKIIESLTETFNAEILVSAEAIKALKNRDNFKLFPAGQKQIANKPNLLTTFRLEI